MSISEVDITERGITHAPSRNYIVPKLGDILAMSPYDVYDPYYRERMAFSGSGVLTVQSLTDSNRNLVQTGAASLRPTYNDAGYVTFDATGTEFLEVLLSTNLYKFLHNGTGCTVLTAANGTNGNDTEILIGTGGASNEYGAYLALDDASPETNLVRATAARGVAGNVAFVNSATSTPSCSVGTKQVYGYTYDKDLGSDEAKIYVDGVHVQSIQQDNAPVDVASTYNLAVGRFQYSSPTLYFEGDWYGSIIFDRVLTANEIKVCSDYLARNF